MEYEGRMTEKRNWKKVNCMVVCLYAAAVLYVASGFIFDRIEKKQNALAAEYTTAYTIAENREILCGLLPERWNRLTAAEKQELLQTAANTEANYLGIPKPLSVAVLDLEAGTRGRYVLQDHEIQIDEDHVENSSVQEVLGTLCHEAYHAYQIAMVEAFQEAGVEKQSLLLFRRAEIYQEELGRYQKGEKDYGRYYNQKLEEDARRYSASAVEDWYFKLNMEK